MLLLEISFLMVKRELTARYRGTIFGYLWSFLNPMAFAAVYYIAFKYIVRIPVEDYSIFLLTGLFPWIWISASIISGTSSFENFQALLKTGYVKPIIIPLLVVFTELTHFLFAIPILLIMLFFSGFEINFLNFIFIPILMIFQTIFLISVVTIVGCLSLVYRDISHMITILIQMLFFLSPIIYPVSLVPSNYLSIYKLNPLVNFFELWRQSFYIGNIDYLLLIYPTILIFILITIAYFVIKKIGDRAVEWM